MNSTQSTYEQFAIDAFVDAVHKGNSATAECWGKLLVKQYFDGDWEKWLIIAEGTLLRAEDFPLSPADCVSDVIGIEVLEGHVSSERFDELQNEIIEGENLTSEELQLWRQLGAEGILTENPD